ncbi:MAG TPA: cation diffusion facilitator family transporter [Vicinamibacterales bacterium]|nr:cation diffusion facilitator family transporter [Vicinamibacterales bacterium]
MTGPPQLLGRARTIAGLGLGINVVLAAANIAAGLAAGSTSAVAAGLEFGGDVIASVVVLAGLAAAARPPDDNHPYGHGRLETLAGFTVGLLLVLGGAGICYRSLRAVREVHPPPGVIALWTLAAAIVVRLIMSGVKLRVGRRLGSAALIADGWNDAVDIISASAAAGAVALARIDPERFLAADHYGGVLVGLVVVLTGVRVARDTSLDLVDTMPEPARLDDIRRVAAAVPGVRRVEQQRARKTGLRYHVDLHVEVDPAISVRASHDIAAAVRRRIRDELPWVADVLVHVEPAERSTAP